MLLDFMLTVLIKHQYPDEGLCILEYKRASSKINITCLNIVKATERRRRCKLKKERCEHVANANDDTQPNTKSCEGCEQE
jgi:hypothetical protein